VSIHPLVEAFYSRIWNTGDLDAVKTLMSADCTFRGSLGSEMRGREAFREYALMVRSALADYRCDVLDCVTQSNQAFAKVRFSGTHVAPIRGFEPTGKQVEWLGAALFEFDKSQITSVWVLGDLTGLDSMLTANCEGQSRR
jgi:steroid delta-isomerase-like uncharacterized protein